MTSEKKWSAKKDTKKGKYVCPECKEHFTLRKEANKHQAEKKHMGAIMVQEKEETKKKSSGKKAPKKPSKKRVKMVNAAKKFNELIKKGKTEKTALKMVAKEVGESERKVRGWFDTLKGEMRRKEKVDAKKETVKDKKEDPPAEEIEEEAPGTIHRFVRIGEDSLKLIKKRIEKVNGIHHIINPTTNNNLIYINSESDYYNFDYLMFLYDFVELELDIGDIIYILEFYSNKKHKLNNKLKIHDIAEDLERWIEDVDDGGCIKIGYNEDESLTVSQIIGRLAEYEEQWMGCIGGDWDKPKAVDKKKEEKVKEPESPRGVSSDHQTSIDEFTIDDKEGTTVDEMDEVDDLLRKDVNSMTEDEWNRYQELCEQANEIDKEIDDSIEEKREKMEDNEESKDEDDKKEEEEEEEVSTTAIVKRKDDEKFNPDSKMYDDSGGVSPFGAENYSSVYSYTSSTTTTPKKKGISFHPIYGMDIYRMHTDRVIDIHLFHPPDNNE